MARKVGLWIDHAKAVLVALDGEDEPEMTTRTIVSNVEKRVRAKGGARSRIVYGPQDATYEARRDRRYEKHLDEYYDQVVSAIAGAGTVLIMGPGEARTDLRKRLEASGVAGDELTVEAADKLTEAQIVEKVKLHYGYPTRATF